MSGEHFLKKIQSGYNMELFIDAEMAQRYLCSICHHVVSDCHETNCGHLFCRGCIFRVLSLSASDESYKCPFCNQMNVGRAPHKSVYLNRAVKCLKVKCAFYEAGCQWTGSLSDLIMDESHEHVTRKKKKSNNSHSSNGGHLSVCKFAPIQCEECKQRVPRAEMQEHSIECVKSCVHCEVSFSSLAHRKRHYKQCRMATMAICPHCNAHMKTSELRQHISFLCALRQIKCPFYHFGCHEIVQSVNLTNHLKYNATQHYQLKVDHCINKMEKFKLQLEQQRTAQTWLGQQNESLTKQLQEVKQTVVLLQSQNQNEALRRSNQHEHEYEHQHQVQNESLTNKPKEQQSRAVQHVEKAPDILLLCGSNQWEETGVFIQRSHLHQNRVCYTSLRTKCAIRWNPQLNAWLIDRRGLHNDNEASLIAYQNVMHPALSTQWLVYNGDVEQWQHAPKYNIEAYNLAEFLFKIDLIFASCSSHNNQLNVKTELVNCDNSNLNLGDNVNSNEKDKEKEK